MLRKYLGILGVMLLGASPTGSANEAKPYSGKTLRVLSFQDNHSRVVMNHLSEFEALTGARVVFDVIASNTVATKIGTDQTAGGSYDLYTVDEPFVPGLSPFFIPFGEWPEPRVIKPTEFNAREFLPAALAGGSYRGVSYGIPINGNVYMYVYRRDLFNDPKERHAFRQKYGYDLKLPQTTDQMRDLAEFFTRPPQLYGFAPFTKLSEGTTVEAIWVLATFGVRIFDDNLKVVMDEKAAAKAFSFYKLMMKFAPPGAANWHHAERMAAYGKGRLVQIMTWPSFVADLENPEKSLVTGKNAYAVPPAIKGGKPVTVAGTWTLAIPKSSKNRELASELAYWWGSKTFGKVLALEGMNPARRDLLRDPKLIQKNPWFPGILANFEQATVRPRFPDYKRVSDLISRHFTLMVSDQETPQKAADGLKAELEKLSREIQKQ